VFGKLRKEREKNKKQRSEYNACISKKGRRGSVDGW
jgi:hypothetical protein